MLIMTQAKTGLVNMDQIIRIFASGGDVMAEDRNSALTLLGSYKEASRCAEIVVDIADKYARYFKVDGGPSLTHNAFVQPLMFEPPKVYEMPQYEDQKGGAGDE